MNTVPGSRRRALAAALAVAAIAVAGAPATAGTSGRAAALERHRFLQIAERGTVLAKRYWWNAKLGWYDERLSTRWSRHQPLVTLWSAYPLFETSAAIAIADPSAAHEATVRAFAAKAEQYFNPSLEPAGGYAYYIGTRAPGPTAYFDDDGWWAIAFLDAYRATGSKRYLVDAARAFDYIVTAGWDTFGGGTWWDTEHRHKTAEPLAAAIYAGASLYRATGRRRYLTTALRYLAWADANSWNADRHLYARSATIRRRSTTCRG